MISIPRPISTSADFVLHVDPLTNVPHMVDADSIVSRCRILPGVMPDGIAAMVSRISGRKPQVVMLDFRERTIAQ